MDAYPAPQYSRLRAARQHTDRRSSFARCLFAQRINFAPGAISATIHGNVTSGGYSEYMLKASAGQNMLGRTSTEEQQVAISVMSADTFSGDLPSTQDYFIKVEIDGKGFAIYQMTVTVASRVHQAASPRTLATC